MDVTTVVTLSEGKDFVVCFDEGSNLIWDPRNIEILHNSVDGSLVVDGPRFEAWSRYRSIRPRGGARCCQHGKRVPCVCKVSHQCPIHGRICHGSHD